jgi:hypothetical protein
MIHKILGRGLQYVVYDIGGNRVRKRPTTRREKVFTLIKWGCFNPTKLYRDVLSAEKITKESVSSLMTQKSDLLILGNPSFHNDLSYEQDKAVTLDVYFAHHSTEENKKIIDLYIENVFQTWSGGFSDTVFNFTVNNAVNNHNEVILIDLGELTFSKQVVAGSISSKKWLKQWSYRQLSADIQAYFMEQMNKKITYKNLNKFWKVGAH